MKNNTSKHIILSVLAVAILVVSVVGISYAIFTSTLEGTAENTLNTGTINMSYTEESNGISITNAMPLTDEAGKALTGENNVFDFTVSSAISGVTEVNYEVVAEKVTGDSDVLADSDVRLYLEREVSSSYEPAGVTATPAAFNGLTVASTIGSPIGSMVLYSGSFDNTEVAENTYSEKFRLRMWLAEGATIDATSRNFQVKVNVYAKVD